MKFIPYVCCGDPNLDFTYNLIKTLASYSYLIELGIPFSDPIADGKAIQVAANRALKNGINVEKVFEMVERLRKDKISVPFVFMTYYNIVYSYGCENFLQKMKEINVQGLIIPDLPFGEDLEFEKLAKKYGVSIINLIAPNTREERAKDILKNEKTFTYLVSVAGVTGSRGEASKESLEFVKRIRSIAKGNKLFVGFGISTVEQANQFMRAGADGVIVGSELINIYSKYITDGKINYNIVLKDIEEFAREIQSI